MDVITCENMRYHVGAVLNHVRPLLHEQIRRGLCFGCSEKDGDHPECNLESARITDAFFECLPQIRRRLATDIQAAYDGDPAATNPAEVIFCYPGLLAITSQRIAHELHILGTPLLPRIITEHAHSITGIDIHPGATIGDGFFIDHGTGTVIGETAEIGDRVTLYQGVTLGAKSFPLDENGNPIKGIPRHPIVESDVVIYANATILGRITIGHDSMIGGNVWVTHDVAPYSKVTMKSLSEERQPQPV
jgi:serine O-acetyltransferase